MLPGRELTIDSTLKMLRRRQWLLIVPLFLGILGGLLYSRSQPSLYRSDAVIQVVPQRVPESYVSATVTERVEDRLRSLAQQVLSRTQLEKLVTDFGLFPDERRRMPMEDVLELMTETRPHRAARHQGNVAPRLAVRGLPRVVRLPGPGAGPESRRETRQLLRRHEQAGARLAGRPDQPASSSRSWPTPAIASRRRS